MSPPSQSEFSPHLVRAGVPPRELISPASGWHAIPSPSTIVTFTSCHASCVLDAMIMHTGRVSCHHLCPSTNNVWTTRKAATRQSISTPRNIQKLWVSFHIYMVESYTSPTRAMWFLKISESQLWLFLLDPYPPPHVIFFFTVSLWQSPQEPYLPWHMANKAGTASEWPCLGLWLSVVPQCLWQHRDRGMKGMEQEGEWKYRDRGGVGAGAEGGFMPEFSPWRHTGSP